VRTTLAAGSLLIFTRRSGGSGALGDKSGQNFSDCRPDYRADFGARDDKMDEGGELLVCVNEFDAFA
jgi:hypothetical protein